ncbi:MAG: TetR/AcrR family transcriptional regulator C-terminal domain-containing protein [Acidimicrobiia bacterium]
MTYLVRSVVMVSQKSPRTRHPLSRDRVLSAAVELADGAGLGALTMRGLADTLDVEAMSLYYHVANKEALLDGVVEMVVEEINEAVSELPAATGPEDWKSVMRSRILAAREVMLRHKWAPAVLETRTTMSPAVLLYHHGLLEIFRAGGVSYDLAHHALHALGSRALGFTQELFDPAPDSDDEEMNDEMLTEMASQVPLLIELLGEIAHEGPDTTIGWCDDQTEFEFGIDLLLDGIERHAGRAI